jgi:GNAT superfamily N-acetyltransferase
MQGDDTRLQGGESNRWDDPPPRHCQPPGCAMSQIAIRSAHVDDIPVLLSLINAAGAGLPAEAWRHAAAAGHSPWDMGRQLMLDERSDIYVGDAWIAEVAGGGYGGLILYVPPWPAHHSAHATVPFMAPLKELEAEAEGTTHVSYLSTLDGWRGHGIGSALLRFSESFRSRRGMSLIVSSANRGARSLYEKFGYSDRSRRKVMLPDGRLNGEDWVLMCKP